MERARSHSVFSEMSGPERKSYNILAFPPWVGLAERLQASDPARFAFRQAALDARLIRLPH